MSDLTLLITWIIIYGIIAFIAGLILGIKIYLPFMNWLEEGEKEYDSSRETRKY